MAISYRRGGKLPSLYECNGNWTAFQPLVKLVIRKLLKLEPGSFELRFTSGPFQFLQGECETLKIFAWVANLVDFMPHLNCWDGIGEDGKGGGGKESYCFSSLNCFSKGISRFRSSFTLLCKRLSNLDEFEEEDCVFWSLRVTLTTIGHNLKPISVSESRVQTVLVRFGRMRNIAKENEGHFQM